MPYFPVDDRFHSHPKSAAASLAAIGLWALAGSWANDHLTDGDVPEHMIPSLSRGATELAEELVAVGLWRRTKAGYRFHQWHADGDGSHRNISRSEAESLRAKKSVGGLIGSHRRWHTARGVTDPGCGFCQEKRINTPNGTTHGSTYDGPNGVLMPPPHPTPPHKPKPSRSPPVSDDDPDWAAFWGAYPRKVGKGQARKAWATAVKTTDPAAIIGGAKRYAEQRRGEDPQYTPHPATWLNGERWADQPAVPVSIEHRPAWWDR